jgi:hypothetical protein
MDFIMFCAGIKSTGILSINRPDLAALLNQGPEFPKQGRGIMRTG